MKLMIERPFVEALVEAWRDLSGLREPLRFDDRAEVAVAHLSAGQCRIGEICSAGADFLTTHRADDIDGAILSRCIGLLYEISR